MPKIKTQVFEIENVFFTADLHLGHTFIHTIDCHAIKNKISTLKEL